MSKHQGVNTTSGAALLLVEQQQCLQQFVKEWCSHQEHILQSLAHQQRICSTQSETSFENISEKNACELRPEIDLEGALSRLRCESMRTEQVNMQVQPCSQTCHNPTSMEQERQARPSAISDPLGNLRASAHVTKESKTLPTAFKSVRASLMQQSSLILSRDESGGIKPRLQCLVTSKGFEAFTAICILANAALIAYAADYAANDTNHSESVFLSKLEHGFTFVYAIELVLRLAAYKSSFFRGKDRVWNIFDTLLVTSAGYDLVMSFMLHSQAAKSDVMFLRVVRVLKVFRLLRMVRVMRMFKELRLIVCSIQSSAKSMFWAVVLIMNITYVAGICFLQAGTSYLHEHRGNVPEEEIKAIQTYWGSVSKAMLSLYMASTGGESWKNLADPLRPVGSFYYVLFLLYVAFFMFVVVNTVTSLFIEATMKNADKDWRMVVREEMQRKNDYVRKAEKLFELMDRDGSGEVTEEEFERYAADPHMEAFAASLDLDVSDITQFYKMLSCRGRYSVDAETFVVGCLKLRGTARSLDLQGLIVSQSRTLRTLEALTECCQGSAALIRKACIKQPVTFAVRESTIPSEAVVESLPEDG